ncbi:MAG TPA: DUF421 domain-containing protein [Plasticicumulans sp.]|nr:MAG: DUF421 domain-containing protein [Xanthomonadales bacterium]HNB89480.1 DUF421 domain-containing protein [Plasticicumulans sp.]
MEAPDWAKLWLGNESPDFLIEIALRSVVMYVALMLWLRLLGRRTLGQLSILEFGMVIILGSAAGDPTFYDDVPLLHGIAVIAVITLLQLGYTQLLARSEKVETLMEGKPVELVRDGVLQVRAMAGVPMNPEEAFEALRLRDIEQLGQVRRAYIEQGGQISVLRWRPEETPPGLPLIPPWDLEQPPKWPADALPQAAGLRFCCANCGLRPDTTPDGPCPHCDCDEWTVAVQRALEPLPVALTRIATPIPEHA